MDKACIARMVSINIVKTTYEETGKRFIPAAGSNRHIHLCRADIDELFGKGYELTAFRPLSQPGQYAAKETATVEGPKGRIENVRVLGPSRGATQAEVFIADCFKLGIKPVIRISGDIDGTPSAAIIGPKGTVYLKQGIIVAARHIHLSPEQSAWLGLKNGDMVSLRKDGERALVFENIPVRCGEGHSLELHLDLEEANAAGLKNGDLLELTAVNKG